MHTRKNFFEQGITGVPSNILVCRAVMRHTAYVHTWIRFLVGMGLVQLYLMVRRDVQRYQERKHRAASKG